jgi:hypothetical protein
VAVCTHREIKEKRDWGVHWHGRVAVNEIQPLAQCQSDSSIHRM